ncbi:MAG TPA: 4Fe-4S binding protein [Patescibacteria group bacterium]|nr:4Fe-4S binding protein [Patescibacteria group bacterium]
MQQKIETFIRGLGVDDVGFARAEDYHNPKSYPVTHFLPAAKSIIVLAFKVLSNCESPSESVALNGYMDLGAFARTVLYRTSRFLESAMNAKVATMPLSYPLEIRKEKPGIADFSQRHAAVAAGLGQLGRHNLVVHPRFGTRVNFVSIITDIPLAASAKPPEDACIHCNICVENCPGNALAEEGRTDLIKCMKHSLPYGLGADIGFWSQLVDSSPETRNELLRSEQYARLRQAAHLGSQYMCFQCMKSCPVGVDGAESQTATANK